MALWHYLAICVILGTCRANILPNEDENNEDSNFDDELSNIPANFKIISAERFELQERDIFHREDTGFENHDGGKIADETEFRGKLGLANIPSNFRTDFDRTLGNRDRNPFYRGDVRPKNHNRDVVADKNEPVGPVRDESCRSNAPERCTYFVRFGKYKKGNKLISHKTLNNPWSRMAVTRYLAHYADFEFPSYNEPNDVIIDSIYISDLEGSERVHDDYFYFLEGGIGQKFFKLRFESGQFTSGYEIYVYGKSK